MTAYREDYLGKGCIGVIDTYTPFLENVVH